MNDVLEIKIRGLNLSRIVDLLISQGVYLNNLTIKSRLLKFSIRSSDFEKLKKICKRERKEYHVVHKNIFIRAFEKLKYSLGFVLSFVIVFSYLLSINMFVSKVNVVCGLNADFDTAEVQELLSENGYIVGVTKSSINKKEISNLIVSSLDNVASCGVSFSGNTLNVIIYPAIMHEGEKVKNIKSKYDGVVTKVKLISGTLNCKIGDIVKKGDVLVYDDEDARAEIYGKVYYSSTLVYNENQVEITKTGRFLKINNYKIFNKNLYKQSKNIPFSKYLVKKCDFYLSENYFLPIKCEQLIVYEVEFLEVKKLFKDEEEPIKERLKKEALAQVEVENSVTNITYSIIEENGCYRVDCYVECEVKLF